MSTATAIILDALDDVTVDALVTNRHAQSLAEELAAALEARGYAVKKKPAPRKPAAPAEIFSPNTGDAALDDFMREHHDPKYKPLPMPKSTFPGYAARPLRVILEEAIQAAKSNKWPGAYTGNFAMKPQR